MLAYEYYDKMKDYKKSLDHIAFCEEHLQFLTKNDCKDKLFTTINSALWHVTLATKVTLLHLSKAAIQDIQVIPPSQYMLVLTGLLSREADRFYVGNIFLKD